MSLSGLSTAIGLSIDYQAWNITGYIFYTVYTIAGYIEQHRLKVTTSIEPNDIAFAVHALIATSTIITQIYLFRDPSKDKINYYHIYVIAGLWLIAIYNMFLGAGGILPWYSTSDDAYAYSAIQFLGFGKSFVSLIKYTPQAYLNYKRKSTVGWSIGNIMLDITGGILSFSQMFVNAYNTHDGKPDFSQFTTNVPKLLLALESIAFDLLFFVQHYILYRGNTFTGLEDDDESDTDALIETSKLQYTYDSEGDDTAITIHSSSGHGPRKSSLSGVNMPYVDFSSSGGRNDSEAQ